MSNPFVFHKVDFDEYAFDYDSVLAHGLSVSGEDKNYFAQGRLAWLAKCLRLFDAKPQIAMDFGCGTGSASPYFFNLIGVQSMLGIDTSTKSLEVATRIFGSEHARFLRLDHYHPSEAIDLVFCNGVFHHVPLDQRPTIVDYVCRSLKPGGLFSVWENNPLNPGARYVMSRIPFDRDAIMVTAAEARRLLRAARFEVLRTDFLFIFPRMLRCLRGIERYVSRLPLGAQYQVLARKPYQKDATCTV
jgi:SAM-dependent methyltransferase